MNTFRKGLLLCLSLSACFLEAQITYVPQGDSTSATIQGAISAATAGDTLILRGKKYLVTSQITIDKPLTLKGMGPYSTSLVSQPSGLFAQGVENPLVVTASNVTLSDFQIVQNFVPCCYDSNDSAISCPNAISNFQCRNLWIGYQVNGIYVGSPGNICSNVNIENCQFFCNASNASTGSNSAIILSGNAGNSFICNNGIIPSSNQTTIFVYMMNNGSTGALSITGNTQLTKRYSGLALKSFYLQNVFGNLASNFQLTISNNSFIYNAGGICFFSSSPPLDSFSSLRVTGNTVGGANTCGLVSFDGPPVSYNPMPLISPIRLPSTIYTVLSVSGNSIKNSSITQSGFAQAAGGAGGAIGYKTRTFAAF